MAGRADTAHRVIEAPASAIYRAMISAEALEHWLPPRGMTGQMLAFEPRPGGHYRMALRYDDPQIAGKSGDNTDIVSVRFVALEPGRSVVQEVDFVADDPRFAGTMTMRWLLAPEGTGTRVTIIAENVPEGISAADHAEGFAASLQNLADYVVADP